MSSSIHYSRFDDGDTNVEILIRSGPMNSNREEPIDNILNILRLMQRYENEINRNDFNTPYEDVKVTLSKKDVNSIPDHVCEGNNHEKNRCSICLSKYIKGSKIKTLSCNHQFHSKCIDKWLLKYNDKCPLCKTKVN